MPGAGGTAQDMTGNGEVGRSKAALIGKVAAAQRLHKRQIG